MADTCRKCGERLSNRRNLYCGPCGRQVRGQLARSGYLQDTHVASYFSEERGRKGMRNMTVVGGAPH